MESTDQNQDCRQWKDDDFPLAVITKLNELREKKQFCDITLKIDSQSFAAHRNVLYSLSPYFKALLISQFSESEQDKIELKSCDPEIFKLILNFAYSGSVTFTKLNAIPLLVASDHFQLLKLKNAVALFLEDNNFDNSNCFELYCLADMLHCLNLKEICESYILSNFAKLCKQGSFFSLSTELPKNLISSDDLMQEEESGFQAVYDWFVFDIDNRKEDLINVLNTVRLGLLRPYFLVKLPEKYPAISNNEEALSLIKEKLCSLLLRDRNTIIPNLKNKPRKMVFYQAELAVMENDVWFIAEGSIVWQYNVRLDKLEQLNKMVLIESIPGLTYVNGFLYAVGLKTGIWYIERYDLNIGVWNVVMKLNENPYTDPSISDCTICSIVAVNDKLYAEDALLPYLHVVDLENLTKYRTEERTFERKTSAVSFCANDSYIYVIGGGMKEVERYNVYTDTWEFVSPMLTERSWPGVAVRDGKIFVSGGDHDTVEVYDPCRNFWSVCDYPYAQKWPTFHSRGQADDDSQDSDHPLQE